MIIENSAKTTGKSATPQPNAPLTDATRSGGMIGTMSDPYRGSTRGSHAKQSPSQASKRGR